MDFKWDITLCRDKVHKAIGIVFLTIKNRKDSSVQWYTLPLSVNTPCVIIKLHLKHLLNAGKKLSCDLPENDSVDRFDSRK